LRETVVVYSTTWCPACIQARRTLRHLRVPFEDIDIEEVSGAEQRMRSINGGSDKVPTIVVGSCVLVEPSDTELIEAVQRDQKLRAEV